MGKYGHKNSIKLDPLSYNIGLLGEAGIGKSTIMKQICEKLAGEDGYLALDIGKEDGHDAISGIVTEKVPDWATFDEITDDIIENKETDYPNLRVILYDTYDQLCDIAEKETIRQYNRTVEKKVSTINQAYGGFGRGLDHTVDLILDKLWELKKVGVSFIIIAHVKRTDITDVMTEDQYTMLTSNTTQKYFNAIKQKLHFLGMAYIDREIVQERTKKKDKDGNYISKGKVASESRVINFRDDTYSVDSKSRFANIVPKISFDADEFIKAMQDAILAEQKKDGISVEEAEKLQKKEAEANKKKAIEYSENTKATKVNLERNEELANLLTEKAVELKKTNEEKFAQLKELMNSHNLKNFKAYDEIPTAFLEELAATFL